MADNKKAKRRLQNVEAAKRSYETKKKERNELQEKNTSLVEQQMSLLLVKSRLEEKAQMLEKVLTALKHECSGEDEQLTDCLIVDSSTEDNWTGPISDVSLLIASSNITNHIDNSDCYSNIYQSEDAEAVKNLLHLPNIALDLSARTGSINPPFDHSSHSSSELSDQKAAYDVDDGLNIGATQEVELTTRGRKNRRQDGGVSGQGQHSVLKKTRQVSPNSCARSLRDSKRTSQLTHANGPRVL